MFVIRERLYAHPVYQAGMTSKKVPYLYYVKLVLLHTVQILVLYEMLGML